MESELKSGFSISASLWRDTRKLETASTRQTVFHQVDREGKLAQERSENLKSASTIFIQIVEGIDYLSDLTVIKIFANTFFTQ
jgi:phosphoribosylformimino-5-aminoimidazole carboxamide ribonucleotide (ProFAR) isomerase